MSQQFGRYGEDAARLAALAELLVRERPEDPEAQAEHLAWLCLWSLAPGEALDAIERARRRVFPDRAGVSGGPEAA